MDPFSTTIKKVIIILTLLVTCNGFGQVQSARINMRLSEKKNSATELAAAAKPAQIKEAIEQRKKLPLIIENKKVQFNTLNILDIKKSKVQGPGSGGGGNECALMIKQHTKNLLLLIDDYTELRFLSLLPALKQSILDAKFAWGHDLYINGKKVSAINYPDENLIVIEQSFCDKVNSFSPASAGLLLHEYFGLARIDDLEFKVSGDFIAKQYRSEMQIRETETTLQILKDQYAVVRDSIDDGVQTIPKMTTADAPLFICTSKSKIYKSNTFLSMGTTMDEAVEKIRASCRASENFIGEMKDLCEERDLVGNVFCYKFKRAD